MSLDFVILAAGVGSRMNSSTPKMFHKVAGKPIIRHIIDNCKSIDHKNIIVVTTHELEKNELFRDTKTCVQERQIGTADAVISALSIIESEYVMIICADTPLITSSHLDLLQDNNSDISFLAMEIPENLRSMPYGRVILNNSLEFEKIVEYADANEEERSCIFANSAIYKIKTNVLKKFIFDITPSPVNKELYLTKLLEIAKDNGASISVVKTNEYWPFHGVNTLEDLANAEKIFQNKLREKFMKSGVKLISPETVFFSWDTEISRDVEIEPNVIINEKVTIASGVRIKSFSYLEDCNMKENVSVGPFARIRGNSILQQNSDIGNFVEIKGSVIGHKSKVKHLSYIGDSTIGEKSNIGAGTITCNYDGVKKHKTTIGDNVMVGSNCSLIAPITIRSGAIIGAGSVITKDVPENSLAIARPLQETKSDGAINIWKKKGK